MGQGLKQILSQQMKLTPQQILMSSLLQLPITALEQRLKQELEQNPLLEESQELEEELDEEMELELEQEKPELKQEEPEKVVEAEKEEIKAEKEKEEKEEQEVDWEKILNDDNSFEIRTPRGQGENDDEQEWIQPAKQNLSDHLLEQLRWTSLSDAEKEIAEYIIFNLNEDGYLVFDEAPVSTSPVAESAISSENPEIDEPESTVAPAPASSDKKTDKKPEAIDPVKAISTEFSVSEETVLKVLSEVQKFDPSGIAARNLKECLLIQLSKRLDEEGFYENGTALSIRILKETYSEFMNRRLDKIAKQLGVSLDAVKACTTEILALNTKPGEGYITTEQNYITPDATVKKINDKFEIILNDYDVPHLRINSAYRKMMLAKGKAQKDTKEFIKNKLEAAKWLINSLYRRRDTIYRTIETIVDLQKEFFEKGPDFLKPMKLEDIATRINMDISTVSRSTNGKYIQTDYGVLELKYFFSTAMTNSEGEDVSTRQIKTLLKQVIEEEDKKHPYSDEELANLLTQRGTPIARRTITKYREQMMIPPGRLRKQI